MIIGFAERRRTVSESMAPPGEDTFSLPIGVAMFRTAEREHPMDFILQVSSTSAIVEPIGAVSDQLYDATFGTRQYIDDPVEEFLVLESMGDTIQPLTTFIRNDFRVEDQECFTIRVLPVDIPGRRELFACNEDVIGATNHFCLTEVCIEDDDGMYLHFICHL